MRRESEKATNRSVFPLGSFEYIRPHSSIADVLDMKVEICH